MRKKTHSTATENADQRLSQLVKLKKLERPDTDFWRQFEQEFRTRQLSTLVQVQPVHTRLRRACLILARNAAPPVAALGVVSLTIFAVDNASHLAQSESGEPVPPTPPPEIANKATSQDPVFLVEESNSEPTKAPISTFIHSGTTYQINELNSNFGNSGDYFLNAAPVTYTQEALPQSIGAKVISQQTGY